MAITRQKIRKAVIPVAGLGTRFLPATKAIPKELFPIVDIPMIELIVREAVSSGIEDIILVTARGKTAIEDHFDYSYELEDVLSKRNQTALVEKSRGIAELCNIISVRQKNPLGLGHAVLTAQPIVGNEPFAVLLGDDLILADPPCTRQLIDIYEQRNQSVVAIMEVPSQDVSKYGIVKGDLISDRLLKVEQLVEKPAVFQAPSRFAIPGRYVLSPKIFECLKDTKPGRSGEIQLTDALQLLAQKKTDLDEGMGLLAYLYKGERYDVGDRLGMIDATLRFALDRTELKEPVLEILKRHLERHE